jgi:hypothetical protein
VLADLLSTVVRECRRVNRNLTKGQQAMALAMIYPEPDGRGRGNKGQTAKLLETSSFSRQRLDQARKVFHFSRPMAEAGTTFAPRCAVCGRPLSACGNAASFEIGGLTGPRLRPAQARQCTRPADLSKSTSRSTSRQFRLSGLSLLFSWSHPPGSNWRPADYESGQGAKGGERRPCHIA